MADDILVLADFVGDALDLSPAQVTDLSQAAPVLMTLPMVSSSNGTNHKYVKETGAPVVGFRAVNAGRELDHSVDTVVSLDLKVLDFSWAVDYALAKAWRKGGAPALIAREGLRHLKAAFYAYERQIFYGTGVADSGGFAGLLDNAQFDALADTMVVNAAGSTANTGSSVWLITAGENAMCSVMRDENPIELGETVVMDMLDGSSKHFPAYYTPGSAWCGLQIGGAFDIARIANLTEDSGKGLTDDLIYQALTKFPGGRVPTHIVMNRRSLSQLRKSRTATNATGTPAPIPREVEGIPIIVTEALSSTEAIET
jgi:hypothetical protein